MRPQDKRAFSDCAKALKLWILVRRTNPASLQYIGRPGFVPKPIDCKAKTADTGAQAGLVVSAELLPGAFSGRKMAGAQQIWREFAVHHIGQGGYQVDSNRASPRFGCVLLNGNAIYGDYDLYDIIIPGQVRSNLAAVETLNGQPHRRGPRFYAVQKFINDRIGAPVVQHGGEAQYADHSEQSIDAFGPDGEEVTILNEYSVRGWYEGRFEGRKTLG